MAVSFTDQEKTSIIKALRQAAGRRAATVGFRKTTVDELARDAGISKGAFYKFYPSKEHLFLDMLEEWRRGIYARAEAALAQCTALPPRRRAAAVFKAAWRAILEQPMAQLRREELPLLLRKIPDDANLVRHYESEDAFISALIDKTRVRLAVTPGVACEALKLLMLTVITVPQCGADYDAAMDQLIDGLCGQIILPD